MKKISIIVPVFNAENYIRECLNSLVNQTLAEIEVVVINDASTDGSSDILSEYAYVYPNKLRILTLEKNSRQGTARNLGIRESNGEYIMFVDSDDILDINACEQMYRKADESNSDIVFCDYETFDNTNKSIYCQHVHREYLGTMTIAKKKALLTTSVVPWAKIIRHQLITDNCIFFPEKVFYEDLATTYLFYLYASKTDKVEKAFYKYRMTSQSTTTQRNQKRHYQYIDMANLLLDRIRKIDSQNIYLDEMEFFAFEQMYCIGIKNAMRQFDQPSFAYLDKLLLSLENQYPDYAQNIYFKKCASELNREILKHHKKSASTLFNVFQTGEIEKYCPNYTYLLTENRKIEKLIEYFNKEMYQTALWGAGKYGHNVIKAFSMYQYDFNFLVDRNIKLKGMKYDGYCVSWIDCLEEVDLIVAPFSSWTHDIRNQAKDHSRKKIKILDLEIFVKHELDISIEQYME